MLKLTEGDHGLQGWLLLIGLTGLRIGEALSCELVGQELVVRDAKTEAGVRHVPVTEGVRRAYQGRAAWGRRYLQKRLTGVFKTFGIFGACDVHSLRRTTAQAFSDTDCPEHIAAAIMGHKHKSLTYGLYARGPTTDPDCVKTPAVL